MYYSHQFYSISWWTVEIFNRKIDDQTNNYSSSKLHISSQKIIWNVGTILSYRTTFLCPFKPNSAVCLQVWKLLRETSHLWLLFGSTVAFRLHPVFRASQRLQSALLLHDILCLFRRSSLLPGAAGHVGSDVIPISERWAGEGAAVMLHLPGELKQLIVMKQQVAVSRWNNSTCTQQTSQQLLDLPLNGFNKAHAKNNHVNDNLMTRHKLIPSDSSEPAASRLFDIPLNRVREKAKDQDGVWRRSRVLLGKKYHILVRQRHTITDRRNTARPHQREKEAAREAKANCRKNSAQSQKIWTRSKI